MHKEEIGLKNHIVYKNVEYLASNFCVQDGVSCNVLAGKNSRGYHLKCFVRKVARGNAVQIFSNFPAKSLSI